MEGKRIGGACKAITLWRSLAMHNVSQSQNEG